MLSWVVPKTGIAIEPLVKASTSGACITQLADRLMGAKRSTYTANLLTISNLPFYLMMDLFKFSPLCYGSLSFQTSC